ncbi:unnamed protein product [Prorocentrum cordatum]|uniref:Uncharacterized protein n=1 Tax=Prorocentrum cordatum TaxID=2364126 RepID=A0ABN9V1Q8_9DINO|nr:unnamed protein product [Polarella glacialis]
MCNSICLKISGLQWQAGFALHLTEVIQNSVLTDAMEDALQDACDQLSTSLAAAAAAGAPMQVRGAGAPTRDQLLRCPNNYLANKGWIALENPRATCEERDEIVVIRLGSVGVRHANEDGLIKLVMCLLIDIEQRLHGHWQSSNDIYKRVKRVKSLFTNQQPWVGTCTDRFPDDPVGTHLMSFYSAADPPIARANHSCAYISQHVPLRSTSKLLKTDDRMHNADRSDPMQQALATCVQAVRAASAAAAAPGNDLGLTCAGKYAHLSPSGSSQWSRRGDWGSQQSWDSWASEPWSESSKAHFKPRLGTGEQTLEQYEEEAFTRLKMRKPAAAATKTGAAPAAKKRPAAAALQGEAKTIKYTIKWEKADKKSTKNAFASRHYGRATKKAKEQFPGISELDLKATIQKVYRDAAALWSKHMGRGPLSGPRSRGLRVFAVAAEGISTSWPPKMSE